MGKLKQHFHEEICAGPEPEYEPTPEDEIEMLQWDAECAARRYAEALKKREEKANVKPV